jgi:hypothetical protein
MAMGKASSAKAARRLAGDDPAAGREFWHGGARHLTPGTILVPGNQVPGYAEIFRDASAEVVKVLGQNWVYVTTDRDLALDFAAQNGSLFGYGALYKVQSLGELVPDPDFAHVPGISYRVRRARVIALEQEFDDTAEDSPTGAVLRYVMWDDGTRMYDDGGKPLPNMIQAALGVTAGDLQLLRRGAPFAAIQQLASDIVKQRNPRITQARINEIQAQLKIRRPD